MRVGEMLANISKFACAAAICTASLAATPAFAAKAIVNPTTNPCTAIFVNNAIACQGYYGKNLITGGTGSATTAEQLIIINLLLNGTASTGDNTPTNNTAAYNPPYTLGTSTVLGALDKLNGNATFNFGSLMMSGFTVLGAHFGNNIDTDANSVTAFWLLDLGNTPTNTIKLSNGAGSSNAQIFATGVSAVPEPNTWAMMLFGFGVIGVGMRRRRRTGQTLLQVA